MNKVITVNLNGNAYQLEENGYEALQGYLQTAAAKLAGNPDRDEIIADIEQAIAEKFRALLSSFKSVVTAREVAAVIAEMGPVNVSSDPNDAASADAGTPPPGSSSSGGPQPPPTPGTDAEGAGPTRRLYRINEGAMIGGVCNGISAYAGIDVTLVRIVFVVLAIASFGTGVLAYLALMFIIPKADSAAQKAAAHGATATAQEFIRRARQGYYNASKGFSDRASRRAWRKKFKREMRDLRRNLKWEVRASATQCQQNWHQYWAQHPGHGFDGWASASLLGIIEALFGVACLVAVISLILTGTIFGFGLPGVHLWVAILLVLLVGHFLTWPIRAARNQILGHRPCCCGGGFYALLVLFLVGWFVFPHQTREFLHSIPPAIHHAVDQLRAWWHQQ